jgi:hypothetical protein
MKNVLKLFAVIVLVIMEYWFLNNQTEYNFSILSEFCREILKFDIVNNLKIWIGLIIFLGIFFISINKRSYEIVILILFILILVASFPFFNLNGVERTF